MFSAQETAQISIALAIGALIVSVISLWRSHFSRPHAIVLSGRLRQRIYPIRSEPDTWYLPSFDLPVTFLNPGAQPIIITGIQLRLRFTKLPIPNNYEIVPALWEIAPSDTQRISKDRFNWIDDISPTDFIPFAVLPRQTVVKAFVLETRWENPVITDELDVTLEWRASSDTGWRRAQTWKVGLSKYLWGELANVGTSISYYPEGSVKDEQRVVPKDLHKYTGTKEVIPDNGFDTPPSFLDFPKKKRRGSRRTLVLGEPGIAEPSVD